MNLEQLLRHDPEAARYYHRLPIQIQNALLRCDGIGSLAALRDYATNLIVQNGPYYHMRDTYDGTKLEPELKARWTMEHEV